MKKVLTYFSPLLTCLFLQIFIFMALPIKPGMRPIQIVTFSVVDSFLTFIGVLQWKGRL